MSNCRNARAGWLMRCHTNSGSSFNVSVVGLCAPSPPSVEKLCMVAERSKTNAAYRLPAGSPVLRSLDSRRAATVTFVNMDEFNAAVDARAGAIAFTGAADL